MMQAEREDNPDLEYVEEDTDLEDAFEERAAELRDKRSGSDDSDDDSFVAQPGMQKTLDATQLYLNEIGFSPLLTPEEEVYYARRALRGHEDARGLP